jgi:hypothetical protein
MLYNELVFLTSTQVLQTPVGADIVLRIATSTTFLPSLSHLRENAAKSLLMSSYPIQSYRTISTLGSSIL